MRKKQRINRISTRDMDIMTWLQHRQKGIGTSEIGIIMGLSPYKSSIELFYEKCGDVRRSVDSLASMLGRQMEPIIADMWEAWDGSEETMLENMDKGVKVRRCVRVNAILSNEEYPWLFTNLDRKIVRTDERGEGTAELKTIGGWEADKWEAGIPPAYIMQLQGQMICAGFDFGELAILDHGRRWKFDVVPFEYMEDIAETIIVKTKDFWDRVVRARELQMVMHDAKANFNMKLAEEAEAEFVSLEPAPDGSAAYEKYIKERYNQPDRQELAGTDLEYQIALADLALKAKIEQLETERREHQNVLRRKMGNDCTSLNFGKERGYISWKPDVNNVRRFINKAK